MNSNHSVSISFNQELSNVLLNVQLSEVLCAVSNTSHASLHTPAIIPKAKLIPFSLLVESLLGRPCLGFLGINASRESCPSPNFALIQHWKFHCSQPVYRYSCTITYTKINIAARYCLSLWGVMKVGSNWTPLLSHGVSLSTLPKWTYLAWVLYAWVCRYPCRPLCPRPTYYRRRVRQSEKTHITKCI